MRHLMLDIETLDQENTSAVISIGAVVFNPETPEVDDRSFHANITMEEALTYGSYTDDTIDFWARQPEEARATLYDPEPVTMREALTQFNEYIKSWSPRPKFVWGNSPAFDIANVRHAYKQVGMKFPFTPWVEMDVRTLKNLLAVDMIPKKSGTNHSAVDDCRWQCKIVQLFHGVDF